MTKQTYSTIRVLIADDHALLRAGFQTLLRRNTEIEFVGEAENGREVIELAGKLKPDIIFIDISMPVMDGIEATRRIHAEFPFIQIFGLSAHERTENLHAIRRAGGSDYFIKGADMQRLIDCFLSIRAGKFELRKTAT